MGLWKKLIEQQSYRNRRAGYSNEKPVILVNRTPEETFADELATYQQNELIQMWIPKVRRALRTSARWFSDGKTESFVLRHNGAQLEKKLAESIGSYTKAQDGAIFKIAFKFERHGVFVHKGVGRGYKAAGQGFVNRIAKGPQVRPRIAVEWFNPVLDQHLPELVDRLAVINADAAVNATRMMIQ
jgi:hypothetical protein